MMCIKKNQDSNCEAFSITLCIIQDRDIAVKQYLKYLDSSVMIPRLLARLQRVLRSRDLGIDRLSRVDRISGQEPFRGGYGDILAGALLIVNFFLAQMKYLENNVDNYL